MARVVTVLVLLLGASMLLGTMRPAAEPAGPCVVVNGPSSLPDLKETSGLAVSRRDRSVLWSHNDSGNDAVLVALDVTGTLRGRLRVPIRPRDWEDISAARCPAGTCLYLADIGDNQSRRRRVTIYRIPEPLPDAIATARPEVLDATYADGPHNAEAMFVLGAELFIVTRDGAGVLYRAQAPATGGGQITFRHAGQLGLQTVTDAEASPDEQVVVVRNPLEAVFYRAAELLAGRTVPFLRIPIDGFQQIQGEGIALDGDRLHLSSEAGPWGGAGSLISLRCQFAP